MCTASKGRGTKEHVGHHEVSSWISNASPFLAGGRGSKRWEGTRLAGLVPAFAHNVTPPPMLVTTLYEALHWCIGLKVASQWVHSSQPLIVFLYKVVNLSSKLQKPHFWEEWKIPVMYIVLVDKECNTMVFHSSQR